MKKWITMLSIGIMLAVTVAAAQHAPGPERRDHNWARDPEPRHDGLRGFCYSRRTQECTSIFKRDTEQEFIAACEAAGWRRYSVFRTGREAMQARRQQCSN